MNENKTAKMLDIIQAKRGVTLGEVAEMIGRSRAYLSQAKARPDSPFLIRLLEEYFADELKGAAFETKSPAPDPVTMLQDQVQDLRKHNEQLTKVNDTLLLQVQANFADVQLRLDKQAQLVRDSMKLQLLIAGNGDQQKGEEIAGNKGKKSNPKSGQRNGSH